MRTLFGLVCAMGMLAASACVSWSDPFERERALTLAQRSYTNALRWGNLDGAAQYVEPSLREEFLSHEETFASVRITDYDIGTLEMDTADMERAEVDVTFRGYVLPHYLENRARDHQVWVRDVEGDGAWRVRPEVAALLDGLGAKRSR